MTSHFCCSGFIDEGIPKGEVTVVDGIRCYRAAAPVPLVHKDKLIIIGTDVFGYTISNIRLIADTFSRESSSLCLVPDLFNGTEPPPSLIDSVHALNDEQAGFFAKLSAVGSMAYHIPGFFLRNPRGACVAKLLKVIDHYKRTEGIKDVLMVGYCFGGGLAIDIGQRTDGAVTAFCAVHPAGFDIPAVIARLAVPAAFLLTPDKDFQLRRPECELIQRLLTQRDTPPGSFRHAVRLYDGMAHGFAVRGNEKDPAVLRARLDALNFVLDFYRSSCFATASGDLSSPGGLSAESSNDGSGGGVGEVSVVESSSSSSSSGAGEDATQPALAEVSSTAAESVTGGSSSSGNSSTGGEVAAIAASPCPHCEGGGDGGEAVGDIGGEEEAVVFAPVDAAPSVADSTAAAGREEVSDTVTVPAEQPVESATEPSVHPTPEPAAEPTADLIES